MVKILFEKISGKKEREGAILYITLGFGRNFPEDHGEPQGCTVGRVNIGTGAKIRRGKIVLLKGTVA